MEQINALIEIFIRIDARARLTIDKSLFCAVLCRLQGSRVLYDDPYLADKVACCPLL